ncbi:insulin-like growth factor-binding protein complex acid labile subunit [Anopheles funestus]|uniref:insulin-like growth factor-binding protein complex acid labile subunit n=1 Tax=Anopheles funestus TaxID=62324 RepID=UPI0020C60CFD|nr:insulin-like growth factor-binding protein complex acid labile subunit [Anopheles funestus]
MVKKSEKILLKLLCVICCTTFAIVAGNGDQQETTAENASGQNKLNVTEKMGRLDGVTLIFDKFATDLSDSSVIQFHPDVICIVISQGMRTLNSNIFQWWENLTTIFLNDNFLTAVPKEALSGQPSLTFLSITNNRLETLGDEFASLPQLETLHLDRNHINALHPNTFGSLRELQDLLLSENRLTSLDGLILPTENQLQHLDVSHNFIKHLNGSTFVRLGGLKELRLASNIIETLHDNTFAELHALQQLDLSDNFLKTLSQKLFTANGNLLELSLENNLIETLPVDVFSGLQSLWQLNLRNNRLTSLDEDIFRYQPFSTQIVLDGNRISTFDPCFLQTRDVELKNNRLTILSKSSFDTNDTRVEFLTLNGNEIATIDESFFETLPKLKSIKLDRNRIAELLPMLFHKNQELERVFLPHNRLSVLRTDTFSGLPKLEHVDLSYNALSVIEAAVFHQSPVKYLNLNDNQLKTIDDWAFAGTKLLQLFVDFNAIDSLNSVGTVLDGLEALSAISNQIESWPEFCTSNFTHLRDIKLANNSISSIEGDCLGDPGSNNRSDMDPVNIDVSYNKLATVPMLDGRIRSLDLSGNNVSDLGDGNEFRSYQDTETLKLLSTSLRMVRSVSFTFLPNLTDLQISSSVLELIEEDAFHALKLQQLVISDSSMQTLPPLLLQEQTSLDTVSLAKNKISHLSSTFFVDCRMLTDINLSQNRLATVDHRWFQGLEMLRTINLAANVITQLPPNLFSVEQSLMTLSLAGNALRTISDADFLAKVPLYELDLSNNNLEDVDILQRNDFIALLYVTGNRLERLPVRPNYRMLKANSNRITSLRWESNSKFNLAYLNLANNRLDQLDRDIFNISTIMELNVSGNRLDTFPFELVYKLNWLKTLNVSRNNIRTLPLKYSVERFKVETLDLSENPLVEQPETFLDICVVKNLILAAGK